MDRSSFERHLKHPHGRGPVPEGAVVGSAGSAACGDVVRVALRVAGGRIELATFEVEGCGAAIAAASACVELVQGAPLLEATRLGPRRIAEALGGLSPGKAHAADLAADAFHRALTNLWSSDGRPLLEPCPGRVLVAMSGGVDSAVAALLAQRARHEAVAVTLKLWADAGTDGTRSCCSPQAVLSARALAHSMGLPHLTLDLEERFRQAVVEDFISEHDRGLTPNPCVRCNGLVRFGSMLELAESIGAEALVTGHYARIEADSEGPLLARAADCEKDQTYMLSAVSPELLARVRFPLGGYTKPEVRRLAGGAGLPVAQKRESQDLCFMAGTNREAFLARHAKVQDRPGEIVDRRGRPIGRHRGHRHFTVGQRRGLGVAAAEPLYVVATDAARNRVIVGTRGELSSVRVTLAPATLYRDGARVDQVRLRYRSMPVPCTLRGSPAPGEHSSLELDLGEPVHGVAAGQSACLLEGGRVLGFGVIAGSRLPATKPDAEEETVALAT